MLKGINLLKQLTSLANDDINNMNDKLKTKLQLCYHSKLNNRPFLS